MLGQANLPLLPLVLDRVPWELRRALDQEGIACCELRPGPPAGRFVLADTNAELTSPLAAGQSVIDLAETTAGFDDDPWRMLSDVRRRRAQWMLGSLPVQEEVATVDKRAVRRRLMQFLRKAIEERGGVWIRLASCPFPYRCAFSLRVDHDDYLADDFDALLAALRGQEHATSHYVCAADFAQRPEALARLRGLHVGGHGYHHHTYADFDQNVRNISRGFEVLEQAGLRPDGFVAPHGRFSAELHGALLALGVSHSSEFGLAYDDLPFDPEPYGVLQTPIHPVCLGIALEAAESHGVSPQFAVRSVCEYLAGLVADRYQEGEPVLLYDHPSGRWGRYPEVVRTILTAADACSMLWRTTLSEIARWWRQRQRIELRVVRDGEEYVVFSDRLPARCKAAIEYWRGEHVAAMPLDASVVRFAPSALAYQRRMAGRRLHPIRVDPPQRLRASVKRFLDWEKATPVDEIDASTLRGWMKRTLRRWRG